MTSHGANTGRSRHAVWRELAEELGGVWDPAGRLELRLGGYDLTLDSGLAPGARYSALVCTSLRAAYVNPRRFRFRIRHRDLPAVLGLALDRQRLDAATVGLGEQWIVDGNDGDRLRAILADPALRAALHEVPRLLVQVSDSEGADAGEGAQLDVLECIVDRELDDPAQLRSLFALAARLLPALNADPVDAFEVPPSQLPHAFQQVLDQLAGAYGGDAERVRDTVEARFPDPLGLVGEARAVVDLPLLPRMVSAMLSFDAPLVPGAERFSVDRRDGFSLWYTTLGDDVIDGALLVRGSPVARPALLAPLRVMARTAPRVEVSADRMVLRRSALGVSDLPALFNASVDLWQELNRHRAGAAPR